MTEFGRVYVNMLLLTLLLSRNTGGGDLACRYDELRVCLCTRIEYTRAVFLPSFTRCSFVRPEIPLTLKMTTTRKSRGRNAIRAVKPISPARQNIAVVSRPVYARNENRRNSDKRCINKTVPRFM